MDELRIEKLSMEDGRQAERHIKEEGYCENEQTRVIDLYVEPERPKKLAKRIVEKRRPCVYRREIETVDENGDVIDRKIESLDPEDKMRLVDHIATYGQNNVSAQAVADECGCPVTRDDLKEVMSMFVNKLNAVQSLSTQSTVSEVEDIEENIDVIQNQIESRVNQKNEVEVSNTTWWLLMVVVAQMAGLVYIWALM